MILSLTKTHLLVARRHFRHQYQQGKSQISQGRLYKYQCIFNLKKLM